MTITLPVVVAITGVLLTFSISLAGVIYRTGHLAARVEQIEMWRTSTRNDMHEISDKIDEISKNIVALTTLIEERTERRFTRFSDPIKS